MILDPQRSSALGGNLQRPAPSLSREDPFVDFLLEVFGHLVAENDMVRLSDDLFSLEAGGLAEYLVGVGDTGVSVHHENHGHAVQG
jgi:hypothetical protein